MLQDLLLRYSLWSLLFLFSVYISTTQSVIFLTSSTFGLVIYALFFKARGEIMCKRKQCCVV